MKIELSIEEVRGLLPDGVTVSSSILVLSTIHIDILRGMFDLGAVSQSSAVTKADIMKAAGHKRPGDDKWKLLVDHGLIVTRTAEGNYLSRQGIDFVNSLN